MKPKKQKRVKQEKEKDYEYEDWHREDGEVVFDDTNSHPELMRLPVWEGTF